MVEALKRVLKRHKGLEIMLMSLCNMMIPMIINVIFCSGFFLTRFKIIECPK